MPRLNPIDTQTTSEDVRPMLDAVKQKLGSVPNLIKTFALSPALLEAYLSFSGALEKGRLSPRLGEQIALAVGQDNTCDYCLAAHSLVGKLKGLGAEEIFAARRGQAADEKSRAALAFARAVNETRGRVADADLEAVRAAGWDDGEVAEIFAHVLLNQLTNSFNHLADTKVDFPPAPALDAGVAAAA